MKMRGSVFDLLVFAAVQVSVQFDEFIAVINLGCKVATNYIVHMLFIMRSPPKQ